MVVVVVVVVLVVVSFSFSFFLENEQPFQFAQECATDKNQKG